jgi:hypothetical protein
MSFILDPPLLVASGAAIEAAVEDERGRGIAARATVATFVGVSLLLYANAPGLGRIWRPFGAASGREFMLTSGLAPIREEEVGRRRHLLALAQFALYPAWLELGRRLARR